MIIFTVGILGGMGPEATSDFYLKVIRELQNSYGAVYDSDYPEIFIYNLPLPDVVGKSFDKQIFQFLFSGIRKLENAGAQIIAIPCNTVSFFIPQLRKTSISQVLSIEDETIKQVKALGYTKVGVLGTQNTIKLLYSKKLNNAGIETLKPSNSDCSKLTKIIFNILKGEKQETDKQIVLDIIAKLKDIGAEAIILGCTELPLLINQNDVEIPLLDTTKILAKALVEKTIIVGKT